MKSKKLIATLLATTVVLSLGLTGCGSKNSGSGSASSGLDKDQYLNLMLPVNDFKTLDPSLSTDLYSSVILQESMEGLAREENKDGVDKYVAAGAEKWDVSADGLTWTFHLRDNKWSDGKPVTADQYEYGIKRTLSKEVASGYAYLLVGAGIKNAAAYNAGKIAADQVGVKATDDKTLVITLEHPCAYFEKLLSFKLLLPQRKDLIDKEGSKYGVDADSLVYNGPFKVKELTRGSQVVLVKNDNYWDKKSVKLDKVTYKFIKETSAAMNSLQSGEIDSTGVSQPEWMDKFDKTGKFTVIKGLDIPSTNYFFYNCAGKYTSNAKVRKALSLAVDKKDLVKVVDHGIAKPAYAWIAPAMQIGNDKYREKTPEFLDKDKDDPKQLLTEGLKELGITTDPSKITLTYLAGGTDADTKARVEWLQDAFKKKLGISIKPDYMEWAQYSTVINDPKTQYDISGMGWSADYNDPMTFMDMYQTGAGQVPTNWSNPTYDKLIDDARSTMDQSKRLKDFQDAEKILVDTDAVINPTEYSVSSTYRYKYVKGIMSVPFAASSEIKYAYTEGRGK